jgi:hypothetical protein
LMSGDINARQGFRYAFIEGEDISKGGDPYLDRLRIFACPLFGIYLHHIHRADLDPDPHDHPWWFTSIILAGLYEEAVWPNKKDRDNWFLRDRKRFSIRRISRKMSHSITVVDGLVWTLVITGPPRGGWGFYTRDGFVSWRNYIGVI